ncbi:YcaO-like family protein [Rhizobium herbae]|uniref:Ribosomal protein S12 methylthiotransferase accessory factor n=1 Tax=Rhizobium herbae TaxID=508661 RepID=A0ABS4EQ13_9HYPH|nr:YcaO-like family protein [Rhizobium herbae]MBP1860041.1 ribosomal protein S12 methylthiotransferase accessory factor [Rhizobium herbae]
MTADDRTWVGDASSYRISTPLETLSRVEPLLKNFGITRVARHTGLDNLGIPVWCAYTPNSKSIVIAQGKGITDADAKASAVMEALERVVAGHPSIDIVTGTMSGLANQRRLADPLPSLIAGGQSDLRPDETIDWVAGRNLLNGQEIFVPLEAVILDRTRQDNRYWMSSDGLASGNSDDEALLHGLLERIERDAYVLWQVAPANYRHSRCVEPSLYGGGAMADILARIERAGLVLRLFDITSDIGIPCFTAFLGPAGVLSNRPLRYVEVTNGSGAHPSPSVAALRAVTEAAQSRLTYISGARDDVSAQTYRASLPDETRVLFTCAPKEMPGHRQPILPTTASMIEHVLEKLSEANIPSAIALRLSSGDWPFSVIKALVPALENPDGKRARRFGARAIARTLWP